MFGYIRYLPCRERQGEEEEYKGYYCGLCKSLRSSYGQAAGLFLSYDTTFLAILLDALSPTPRKVTKETCFLHPFRRRPVIRSRAVDYAADITLLLSYRKIEDNKRDASLLWALPLLGLAPMRKRALTRLSPRGASAEHAFSTLFALEDSSGFSPEQRASAFGTILGEITASYPGLEACPPSSLFEAGFHLGRWIYYIDALDDFEKDQKKNNYNPIPILFPDTTRERVKSFMAVALQSELFALAGSLKQLSLDRNKALIDSLVYKGLDTMTLRILEKFHPSEVDNEKPLRCTGHFSRCDHGPGPESLPGPGQKISPGQTR
ncbi:hypothetical protein JXR74_00605 [Candidatus Mcinerneyibacteriota bacterium]|nr:hypothetical protein [Candidatus Mcinerneyibacteriota bacterium]